MSASDASEDSALAVEATLPSASAPTEPRAGLEYRELKGRIRSALFGATSDPVKIGRFTVLRRLGAGGMGVVYSAYDDELDRKLAIKLLRPELFGDEGQQRLRREAQVAAKLSHPNVVGVFESGVHEGRVYIAMEFVHGRTLGAWLRAEPHARSHDWTRIVDVFLQAGQGLLAAHRAGLVHRDFKPDNVMVGDDGRVRVLDFGVARATVEPEAATERGDSPAALTAAPITVTGAVVGTPAYMAPEQHAGEVADARTDQYAFCLTLWEALFGEPPFVGDDLAARARAKAVGVIQPPARPGRVPARVRRLLARGLAPRRDDRHASMEELLAALGATRRGRRRWIATALVAGFVATGTAAWLGAHDNECAPAREKLHGVWDDAQRDRVVEALRGTTKSGVGDAWLKLEPALDAYAQQWRTAYESACESDDDEELRLQQRLCLSALLRDLGATTAGLAAGDAAIVKTAAEEIALWPSPTSCADPEFLRDWAETEAMRRSSAPKGSERGLVSDFEGEPWTQFGVGWVESVDTLAGGDSEVDIDAVAGGAGGSAQAMRIAGVVRERGREWGWAGAMFMPGDTHMAPANLSDKRRLAFMVRGDPGSYAVMVFSLSQGWEPEVIRFAADREWQQIELALADTKVPLFDVTGIFIGRVEDGRFELFVDDVRLDAADVSPSGAP